MEECAQGKLSINHELLHHIPYGIMAVSFGLIVASTFSYLAEGMAESAARHGSHILFHSFHFLHILFAGYHFVVLD